MDVNLFTQGPTISGIIKQLLEEPEAEFPNVYEKIKLWPFSKLEFSVFHEVLDRFDIWLEKSNKDHDLENFQTKTYDAEHKNILISILKITTLLWDNCTSRSGYNSYDRLRLLLNSRDGDVLLTTVKLLYRTAQRNSSHVRHESITVLHNLIRELSCLACIWYKDESPKSLKNDKSKRSKQHPNYGTIDFMDRRNMAAAKKLHFDYFVQDNYNNVPSDIKHSDEVSSIVRDNSFKGSPSGIKRPADSDSMEAAEPIIPESLGTGSKGCKTKKQKTSNKIHKSNSTDANLSLNSTPKKHKKVIHNKNLVEEPVINEADAFIGSPAPTVKTQHQDGRVLVNKYQDGKVVIQIDNLPKHYKGKNETEIFQHIVSKNDIPEKAKYSLFHQIRLCMAADNHDYHSKLLSVRLMALAIQVRTQLGFELVANTHPNCIPMYVKSLKVLPKDESINLNVSGSESPKKTEEMDMITKKKDLSTLSVKSEATSVDLKEGKRTTMNVNLYNEEIQIALLCLLDTYVVCGAKSSILVNALSASTNHGLLMTLVRRTIDELGNEFPRVSTEYVGALFTLAENVYAAYASMFVSSGFINSLVQILQIKHASQHRFVSRVMNYLDSQIDTSESSSMLFNIFVQDNGLTLIVDRIKEEVDYLLSIPDDKLTISEPENYGSKYPFDSIYLIRSFFKAIYHMLKNNALTEGTRNLIESCLPKVFVTIFEKSEIFGSGVYSLSVNISAVFIHNEPTSLTILQEANLPKTLLDSVNRNIPISAEVMSSLPNAFGAFCLNEQGLNQFLESNPIEPFLRAFTCDESILIMNDDIIHFVGTAIDELIRHHPKLKESTFEAIMNMIRRLIESGNTVRDDDPKHTRFVTSLIQRDEMEEMKSADHMYIIIHMVTVLIFLTGFLQNASHCKEFFRLDGLDLLLKTFSIPTIPFDFSATVACDEIRSCVGLIVENVGTPAVSIIIKYFKENFDEFKEKVILPSESAEYRGKSKFGNYFDLINAPQPLVKEAEFVVAKLLGMYELFTCIILSIPLKGRMAAKSPAIVSHLFLGFPIQEATSHFTSTTSPYRDFTLRNITINDEREPMDTDEISETEEPNSTSSAVRQVTSIDANNSDVDKTAETKKLEEEKEKCKKDSIELWKSFMDLFKFVTYEANLMKSQVPDYWDRPLKADRSPIDDPDEKKSTDERNKSFEEFSELANKLVVSTSSRFICDPETTKLEIPDDQLHIVYNFKIFDYYLSQLSSKINNLFENVLSVLYIKKSDEVAQKSRESFINSFETAYLDCLNWKKEGSTYASYVMYICSLLEAFRSLIPSEKGRSSTSKLTSFINAAYKTGVVAFIMTKTTEFCDDAVESFKIIDTRAVAGLDLDNERENLSYSVTALVCCLTVLKQISSHTQNSTVNDASTRQRLKFKAIMLDLALNMYNDEIVPKLPNVVMFSVTNLLHSIISGPVNNSSYHSFKKTHSLTLNINTILELMASYEKDDPSASDQLVNVFLSNIDILSLENSINQFKLSLDNSSGSEEKSPKDALVSKSSGRNRESSAGPINSFSRFLNNNGLLRRLDEDSDVVLDPLINSLSAHEMNEQALEALSVSNVYEFFFGSDNEDFTEIANEIKNTNNEVVSDWEDMHDDDSENEIVIEEPHEDAEFSVGTTRNNNEEAMIVDDTPVNDNEISDEDELALLGRALSMSMGGSHTIETDLVSPTGRKSDKKKKSKAFGKKARKLLNIARNFVLEKLSPAFKRVIEKLVNRTSVLIVDSDCNALDTVTPLIVELGKFILPPLINQYLKVSEAEFLLIEEDKLASVLNSIALITNDSKTKMPTENKTVIAKLYQEEVMNLFFSCKDSKARWLAPLLILVDNLVDAGVRVEFCQSKFVSKISADFALDDDKKKKIILKCINLIKGIPDSNALYSLYEILLRITKEYGCATFFADNEGLQCLFDQSTAGSFVNQPAFTAMILRHIVEDKVVLKLCMEREIRDYICYSKNPSFSLDSFVKSNRYLIARDIELFIQIVSENMVIKDMIEKSHIRNLSPKLNSVIQEIEGGELAPFTPPSDTEDENENENETKKEETKEKETKEKEVLHDEKKEKETVESIIKNSVENNNILKETVAPLSIGSKDKVNISDLLQSKYESEVSETVISFIVSEIMHLRPSLSTESSIDLSSPCPSYEACKYVAISSKRCLLLAVLTELVLSYPSCKLDLLNCTQRKTCNKSHSAPTNFSSTANNQASKPNQQPKNNFLSHIIVELLMRDATVTRDYELSAETIFRKSPYYASWYRRMCTMEVKCATQFLAALTQEFLVGVIDPDSFPGLIYVQKAILELIFNHIYYVWTHQSLRNGYIRLTRLAKLSERIIFSIGNEVTARLKDCIHFVRNKDPKKAFDKTKNLSHMLQMSKLMLDENYVTLWTNVIGSIDCTNIESQSLMTSILTLLKGLASASVKLGSAKKAVKEHSGLSKDEMDIIEAEELEDRTNEDAINEVYRHSALNMFGGDEEDVSDISLDFEEDMYDMSDSDISDYEEDDSDAQEDMEIPYNYDNNMLADDDETDDDDDGDSGHDEPTFRGEFITDSEASLSDSDRIISGYEVPSDGNSSGISDDSDDDSEDDSDDDSDDSSELSYDFYDDNEAVSIGEINNHDDEDDDDEYTTTDEESEHIEATIPIEDSESDMLDLDESHDSAQRHTSLGEVFRMLGDESDDMIDDNFMDSQFEEEDDDDMSTLRAHTEYILNRLTNAGRSNTDLTEVIDLGAASNHRNVRRLFDTELRGSFANRSLNRPEHLEDDLAFRIGEDLQMLSNMRQDNMINILRSDTMRHMPSELEARNPDNIIGGNVIGSMHSLSVFLGVKYISRRTRRSDRDHFLSLDIPEIAGVSTMYKVFDSSFGKLLDRAVIEGNGSPVGLKLQFEQQYGSIRWFQGNPLLKYASIASSVNTLVVDAAELFASGTDEETSLRHMITSTNGSGNPNEQLMALLLYAADNSTKLGIDKSALLVQGIGSLVHEVFAERVWRKYKNGVFIPLGNPRDGFSLRDFRRYVLRRSSILNELKINEKKRDSPVSDTNSNTTDKLDEMLRTLYSSFVVRSFAPGYTEMRWKQMHLILEGLREELLSDNVNKYISERLFKLMSADAEERLKKRKEKELERERRRKVVEQHQRNKKDRERKRKEEEERKKREELEKKKREEEEAKAAETALEASQNESSSERQIITINGVEYDLTGTDIDLEFLQALPEDMQQEVVTEHLRERGMLQPNNVITSVPNQDGESGGISDDFLDALPDDIRQELLDLRNSQHRSTILDGPSIDIDVPTDFNNPDITLPVAFDGIRRSNWFGNRSNPRENDRSFVINLNSTLPEAESDDITKDCEALRIMDKETMMNILSTMLLPQSNIAYGSVNFQQVLHSIMSSIVSNQQARADILDLILMLMLEGTADFNRIQSIVKESANSPNNDEANDTSESSVVGGGIQELIKLVPVSSSGRSLWPVKKRKMYVHQHVRLLKTPFLNLIVCQKMLSMLLYLVSKNDDVQKYFTSESENFINLMKKFEKSQEKDKNELSNNDKEKDDDKEKDKDRKEKQKRDKKVDHIYQKREKFLNSKVYIAAGVDQQTASTAIKEFEKYPIYALFVLLESDSFIENAELMEALVHLISVVLKPFSKLCVEDKQIRLQDKKDATDKGKSLEVMKPSLPTIFLPCVPPLVHVLTAGNCNGRTFQYDLTVIQALSHSPILRQVGCTSLMRVAQSIGHDIIPELKELGSILNNAQSLLDVHGLTFDRFVSPLSNQAKLLRVLKGLDYIYVHMKHVYNEQNKDGKDKQKEKEKDKQKSEDKKPDLGLQIDTGVKELTLDKVDSALVATYDTLTIGDLWLWLSKCLSYIDGKPKLISIGTVLLPCIESFLVISRPYVVRKKVQIQQQQIREREASRSAINSGLNSPTIENSENNEADANNLHNALLQHQHETSLENNLTIPSMQRSYSSNNLRGSSHSINKLFEEIVAEQNNEELFQAFTEKHKNILNTMVRNNPALMSGSFALLIQNPKVLEFDNKCSYFNQQLRKNKNKHKSESISVEVRRKFVFEDSYHQLSNKSGDAIKYGKLSIKFKNEEGVDAGGVTREWFSVLSQQMFNPDYALFRPSAVDKVTYQPNRLSYFNPNHLSYFNFVGKIIGKAIFDSIPLDSYFTRSFYKMMIDSPVDLKDMEAVDPEYHKSLEWILNNDITDILELTFSIEVDDLGKKEVIDLVPNGDKIAVTNENKGEYVRLIVQHRLVNTIKIQYDSLLKGFHEIIPKDLLKIFNEQELELLISGMPDIDIDDWKNNTIYQNYTPASPPVQWFWRAIRSFSSEERAKAVQFITGTSKVPLGGFAKLQGSNGIQKFQIYKDFNSTATGTRLPTAHTCFNQLHLPEYDSYEQLRSSLLTSISEGGQGFGFA